MNARHGARVTSKRPMGRLEAMVIARLGPSQLSRTRPVAQSSQSHSDPALSIVVRRSSESRSPARNAARSG